MKIFLYCMKCPFEESPTFPEEYILNLREDNAYTFKCSKGHDNTTILQSQKFELLFTSGALSFLDGYLIESVLSFAASLERFYEYYIRVTSIKNGIAMDHLNKTWNIMARQSERQYGAFAISYLIENKTAFDERKYDLGKAVAFRNKVIHQGYFPEEDEVFNYAENVYAFIKDSIIYLKLNCAKAMDSVLSEHLMASRSKALCGSTVSTSAHVSILCIVAPIEDIKKQNLRSELEHLNKLRTAGLT